MHIHIYALCYIIHYIHVYVHTCMYILRFPPLPSPSPLPSPLYFSSERVFFVFTRVRHSISLAHSCTFVSSLFISRSFWDRCGFLIFFFFLFFFITNFSSSLFRSLFSFRFCESHAIHIWYIHRFFFFLFPSQIIYMYINIIFPSYNRE